MRVLCVGNMYPPHHLGGYELMWRSAVSRMRSRDHDVRILTTDFRLDPPDSSLGEGPDVHRELRWYWRDHEFPTLGVAERMRLERHNADVIDRHLEEFEPGVVSWWSMGGMSLSMIERVRRQGIAAMGVVIDDWMVYGPQVDEWLRSARRMGPAALALERVSGVPTSVDLGTAGEWVFVSERIRSAAIGARHDLRRTSIAHGGVDPDRFPPAPRREWEWRLLYVGRIDPRKGIDLAVRSVAALPDATLRVVGAGDPGHMGALGGLVAELGLEGRVTFEQPGRVEIPGAYAESDAVLFPVQWDEPWGLVPLEAMATGRPVVATGAGGSGEYLRDGENCLIFEPRDDPAALAAAVSRLAADERLRSTLREGGARTAELHTEEAFNDAVVDAIERARPDE